MSSFEAYFKGQKITGANGLPIKPISLTEWNAMTDEQRNREVLWLVDTQAVRKRSQILSELEFEWRNTPIAAAAATKQRYIAYGTNPSSASSAKWLSNALTEASTSSTYIPVTIPWSINISMGIPVAIKAVEIRALDSTGINSTYTNLSVWSSNDCIEWSEVVEIEPSVTGVVVTYTLPDDEFIEGRYFRLSTGKVTNISRIRFLAADLPPESPALPVTNDRYLLFYHGEWVGGTDDLGDISAALDAILGGSSPFNTYSEDEQVVGTWIDGKLIYRKVIKTFMPSVINEDTSITDAPLVEQMIRFDAFFVDSYGAIVTADGSYSGSSRAIWYSDGTIRAQIYGEYSSVWTGAPITIIMEYTKPDEEVPSWKKR